MALIITISRGSMSGGQQLAERLSKKLGYPAISREAVKDAALQHGISEEDLARELEKKPGFFDRLTKERRCYLLAIQSALVARARKGSYIYHGHAGHLLLKGLPQVLKVRLIAPVDIRIKMLRETLEGMTVEEAQRHIDQVDRKRMEWTRFLYGVDWQDASLYDIVLNLATITVEGACDLVARALSLPEFRDTKEKRQALEDFALACEVKVALALNGRTKGMDFEVQAHRGSVKVAGRFYSSGILPRGFKRGEAEVLDAVESVPGVKDVKLELEDSPIPIE
ncbi:MAG: cytidylate kinase-like family protein [Elusimicrobiota bacterium]